MTQEISFLQKECKLYSKSLDDANRDLEVIPELKRDISELTKQRDRFRAELEDTYKTVVGYEEKFVDLTVKNEEVKKFQIETENILKDKDLLVSRLDLIEKDNLELRARISEFENLRRKVQQLGEESDKLREALDATEADLASAKNENCQLYVESITKDGKQFFYFWPVDELGHLKSELEQLRSQREMEIQRLTEDLNATRVQWKGTNQVFEEDRQVLTGELLDAEKTRNLMDAENND